MCSFKNKNLPPLYPYFSECTNEAGCGHYTEMGGYGYSTIQKIKGAEIALEGEMCAHLPLASVYFKMVPWAKAVREKNKSETKKNTQMRQHH